MPLDQKKLEQYLQHLGVDAKETSASSHAGNYYISFTNSSDAKKFLENLERDGKACSIDFTRESDNCGRRVRMDGEKGIFVSSTDRMADFDKVMDSPGSWSKNPLSSVSLSNVTTALFASNPSSAMSFTTTSATTTSVTPSSTTS
jgi:hypothetical protein